MQDKSNKQTNPDKGVKQKHVGDETPNPLPDNDYSSKQPPNDDSEGNPDSDSSGR